MQTTNRDAACAFVPADGDTLTPDELRTTHWRVVTKHAEGQFLEALRTMHEAQFSPDWRGWFPALTPPVPRLSAPSSSRALGQYASIGGDGLRGEIVIRRTLLTGEHPMMRSGDDFAEGRLRFVLDVLLHESVHAYLWEVVGTPERAFHGHGPHFAAKCNAIGAALGLGRVRSSKKRGPDGDLPSCAQWPHNVRPAGYYLGAFVPADGDTAPVPPPVPWPQWYEETMACLRTRVAQMPRPGDGEPLAPWLATQMAQLAPGPMHQLVTTQAAHMLYSYSLSPDVRDTFACLVLGVPIEGDTSALKAIGEATTEAR